MIPNMIQGEELQQLVDKSNKKSSNTTTSEKSSQRAGAPENGSVYDFDDSGSGDKEDSIDSEDMVLENRTPKETRKRKPDVPELVKPVNKKRKIVETEETGDKDVIASACLGNFNININCLEDTEQIRDIDEKFVESLVESMREYHDEAYQPPAVYLKNVSKENFKETQRNGYQYQILGGQHMVAACRRLVGESEAFRSRRCVVYAGLSKELRMVVSSNHNTKGANRRMTTLKQKVQFCRRWTNDPSNSFSTDDEWLNSCGKVYNGIQTSRREREVISKLACLPNHVFTKWEEMMEMAERGQLKGQKLSLKERKTGVVDIPMCKFAKAVRLSDETFQKLMERLVSKDIDIKDFVKEAEEILKLTEIQRNFVDGSGSKSWEEATQKFPEKTQRENLLEFVGENFKKGIPESFRTYIRTPKEAEETEKRKIIRAKDVKAVVINDDVKDITGDVFDAVFGERTGVSLTVLDPKESWTENDIEEWIVAYRNMVIGRETKESTLVLLGPTKLIEEHSRPIRDDKMFFKTERIYIVNSFIKSTSNSTMTNCVDEAVVAFYSEDSHEKSLKKFLHGCKDNYILINNQEQRETIDGEVALHSQKPLLLMKELVERFTLPGQLVYEPCCGTGTLAAAALQSNRQCLSVEKDIDMFNVAVRRIRRDVLDA